MTAAASTRVAALSSLLDAEDGLLCRSILRGLLAAAARRGSSGAGLLLPTDLMCLRAMHSFQHETLRRIRHGETDNWASAVTPRDAHVEPPS